MDGNEQISIILINYNGKIFNKNCIDSILFQTYKNFEIIIVDNASSDDSLNDIETSYKQQILEKKIIIVKNNKNDYFAGGNNLGVKYSSIKSKYIWLLNNDTVLDSNCLYELVIGIESDSQLGAVSSLILDKGFEDHIKNKTLRDHQIRTTNIFGQQVWKQIPSHDIKKGLYYTSFLCGCSILYKKKLIKEPFLDFYKIYAEDLQLSWEFILKGHKLAICKKSELFHLGSATMNKVPYLKLHLIYRNVMLNYFGYTSFSLRLRLFPIFLMFTLMQVVFSGNFLMAIKAKFFAWIWILKNKKLLKELQSRILSTNHLTYNAFASQMSYKFADDDFVSSPLKLRIISVINFLIKVYYMILFIPYQK